MNTAAPLTFGARLKWARKRARLTQDQVRDAVRIGQGTLSELENDVYEGSTFTPRLAELYSVSALWLATGKGSADKNNTIVPLDVADFSINNALPLIKDWSAIKTIRAGSMTQFKFKLDNDFMTPLIPAGAVMHIDAALTPVPGKIGIASIADSPVVGTLQAHAGNYWLTPSNPRYAAVQVTPDQLIGSVIGAYIELL